MEAAPDGAADDEAMRAALQVLRDAVTVRLDGGHNRMLQALRHRRDPELRPLFQRLSHANHPALRLHGLLGLGRDVGPAGADPADAGGHRTRRDP